MTVCKHNLQRWGIHMTNDGMFYLYDSFVESPLYDNWFKKHYPQKSLLVCSPYIKKEALDRIISLYDLKERSDCLDIKVLIRGNEEEFTYQKSSDISIFDSLIDLKGLNLSNIRRIKNLHMKAYLIDETYLLITSGNLTNSGIFVLSGKENFEGGISVRDGSIVVKFMEYFRGIWDQSQKIECFYDGLMTAYTTYIETEYSDKQTLKRLKRNKYIFRSKTTFDNPEPNNDEVHSSSNSTKPTDESETFHIELSDIPPVGTLEYIPEVLKIIRQNPEGISYLELGKQLRSKYSKNDSTKDEANRKFGEEKGKFAAFLNFVTIENSNHGKLAKLSKLGHAYLNISDDGKKKLIKDIFFEKPIVVSIMRQSLDTPNFDLHDFLLKNCTGATETTLSRKVGALKHLFLYISSICTEEELKNSLSL